MHAHLPTWELLRGVLSSGIEMAALLWVSVRRLYKNGSLAALMRKPDYAALGLLQRLKIAQEVRG